MSCPSSSRKRLGVIGDPVAHSLSPSMHQPALDLLGIPAVYERWQTAAEDVPSRIESLRLLDVLGANVTVPHKLAVMDHVDEISSAAMRAGAVNTIMNRSGHLVGDNTDIHGFQSALGEAVDGRPIGRVIVLGAGGAARAAVLALEAMSTDRIYVVNRNMDRAARLQADLAPAPVEVVSADDAWFRDHLPQADVLVNATSMGWKTGETPLNLNLVRHLPGQAVVFDMTYRETDLLKAAAGRGLRTSDGLTMLVYQGARAFTLFTGQSAPFDVMLEAARTAQAPPR